MLQPSIPQPTMKVQKSSDRTFCTKPEKVHSNTQKIRLKKSCFLWIRFFRVCTPQPKLKWNPKNWCVWSMFRFSSCDTVGGSEIWLTTWGNGCLSHYLQKFLTSQIPGGDRRISEPSTAIGICCPTNSGPRCHPLLHAVLRAPGLGAGRRENGASLIGANDESSKVPISFNS